MALQNISFKAIFNFGTARVLGTISSISLVGGISSFWGFLYSSACSFYAIMNDKNSERLHERHGGVRLTQDDNGGFTT